MEIYFTVLIFIMGITFGSFFNVCIFRIPEKKSIVHPPSHCYNCNTSLKPLDLIPILSWTLLRGKCRYCGQKISARYSLVELLTGILFILVYNAYGYSIATLYYLILVSLLIIITFIDIDHYIIPDELIILGSVIAVVFNIFGQGPGLKDGIQGAVICGGGMWILIYLIELMVKKEVMGGGDLKLFAMTGLFLGTTGGLLTIILSVYAGAVYGIVTMVHSKIKKQKYTSMIPYGPFISSGALMYVLYGTYIIDWYIGLF